jgi:acetate kinase
MILVLNCGSQSIKWKLFDKNLKLKEERKREVPNSKDFQKILTKELNQLKESYSGKIKRIGHRVVHGGEKFRKPTKITKRVLRELDKFKKLAPLHNPFNILGIKISERVFPGILQFAFFDTEFFADLPQKALTYPLPEKIRKNYGFRRFGFHGISHEYVAKEGSERVKKPFGRLKIITCHLGGGASISAIKYGKAIDTSMGFTPLEGLVMMTRSGDIDPGIVLDLAQRFSVKRVDKILNSQSGVRGISGIESMLDVLKRVKKGDKRAKLALEIFVYRIQKYLGAYFAILGGCDLLVFTGAIGAGSQKIRNMACNNLNFLKKTKILAIETNEELAIARKIKTLKN